ncbi:MAG: 3'-5' exonuclease [Candidatus Omnitrophica bacterium]|jgi:DNA polymerase III alpha subunit (gram-positive type)|nr:3'-5' exonuclease [Candidatus Omnitrophota bacterium]
MDLKKNIEDFNLVFFDLETTGLDVLAGDSICEIGALKIKGREAIDKFHSLVNPKKSMPETAFRIHQICDEDLKGAPYFEDIADKFVDFLKDSIILAYNIDFDLGFINYRLKQMNKQPLELPAIDILCMARKTLRLPRYNLSEIVSYFNIECPGKLHRAMDDAYVASKAFFKLRDILKESSLDNLEDFISLYGLNNEIFRIKEEPKLHLVKKAIEGKLSLKARYLSHQNMMESDVIKPLNLSQENKSFFLWYESKQGKNIRISLNRILDVEIV